MANVNMNVLEELLNDATNDQTSNSNYTEICRLVNYLKSRKSQYRYLLRLIIDKLKTNNVNVAFLALNCLEECMIKIGHSFIFEVCKMTFLNELIKLIHPNYDGLITNKEIKNRLIKTLESWSRIYSKYPKIVHVYHALVSSGVIKQTDLMPSTSPRLITSIGDMYSHEKLKNLIKNPTRENIDSANKVIRHMVSQEEIKIENESSSLQNIKDIYEHCILMEEIIYNNKSLNEDERLTLEELLKNCNEKLSNLQIECDIAASNNNPILSDLLNAVDRLCSVIENSNKFLNGQSLQNKEDDDLLIFFDQEQHINSLSLNNIQTIPDTNYQSGNYFFGNTINTTNFNPYSVSKNDFNQPQSQNTSFNNEIQKPNPESPSSDDLISFSK